ncbi:MAG: decaprenyl-phosphate phosphoribosyltransferase [Acidobacteriota bacterium]|nr:decaprenyl-phosphate phosphoribosyltransferase [Acidobacteriota bacterium]
MGPLFASLRPAQWTKNAFLVAPMVFAEALAEPRLVARVALAFVAFNAAASAIYLVNDLRDREKDRLHPLKCKRPLAAGMLKPSTAATVAVVLVASSLATSLVLGANFGGVLTVYVASNVGYSFGLKNVVILDVMIVASGYVLRVLAGGLAAQVEVSTWILLCTTFLALFLTFSKRRHEINLLADDAVNQRAVLHHYSPIFLDQMINVVTASTLLSYALYTLSPDTVARFGSTNLVFTLPFVLFGIFRYLYLVYQVKDERNPTEAIIYDLPFVANGVLWGLASIAVIYLR